MWGLYKKIYKSSILFFCILFFFKYNVFAINLSADFNKDGVVDLKDLTQISINFNSNNKLCDLNKDGIVDIYDVVIVANQIDSSIFKVFDSNGRFISGYGNGSLEQAIKKAYITNGCVMSNSKIIWNNEYYWTYNGEEQIGKYSNSHDAVSNTKDIKNGKVYNKFGNLLMNNTIGQKGILAVTQDELNLRSEPNWDARTHINIPNKELIEVNRRTNSFYKIRWHKNNNETFDGYVPYYLDFIQDDNNDSMLGYISGKQESNFNPGAVSNNPNDKGGVSVGVWQFSAKAGSLDEFMTWLQTRKLEFYNILNEAYKKDGQEYSNNFIESWKNVANKYYDEFFNIQQEFSKSIFYDSFVRICRRNGYEPGRLLDYVSTRNMIWSSAVHHGPTGAYRIFSKIDPNISMEDYITKVYDGRLEVIADSYPPNSSNQGVVDIYNSIKKRFERESGEIKRCYSREITY